MLASLSSAHCVQSPASRGEAEAWTPLLFSNSNSAETHTHAILTGRIIYMHRRLCQKLDRLGLHETIFGFLCSWLDDRNSRVIAGGQQSKAEPLTNSVFQGTVLGPHWWKIHYGDANRATGNLSFTDTVFADDCNS